MKKLFSKIDQSGQQNPLIGKVFVVGKFAVTVEEVIAQGKTEFVPSTLQAFNYIFCEVIQA